MKGKVVLCLQLKRASEGGRLVLSIKWRSS